MCVNNHVFIGVKKIAKNATKRSLILLIYYLLFIKLIATYFCDNDLLYIVLCDTYIHILDLYKNLKMVYFGNN